MRLDAIPDKSIVDGLKGVLDFYVHKGAAMCRSWPRSPGHRRAPAVEAQWVAFAYAAKEWSRLLPIVQQAYDDLARGTAYTGRDWFMRGYISGIYGYPIP